MSEWISVKDRLPEFGEKVLITDVSGDVLVYSLEQTCSGECWWEDEYWNWYNDVTHWMPLPEPPKDD